MKYDVFICHASEDKNDFVRPLAEKLTQHNIDVWYDEFSLKIGDSLTQKIDEGLSKSNYGIVVLSPNFFNKPWAKRELNGLTIREMVEKKDVILPIWHRINVEDVMQYSPSLADKKAGSSSDGINSLIRELIKKIKPEESPLIVARNSLIKLGVNIPPISNEWWLDIVEYKEFLKYPDLNMGERWIFPLPFSNEDRGFKRGKNIGSAALQSDWAFEANELNISPTTHPEKVHEFIHRWPGLYDYCREYPDILAMYAPQLTIPGFDSGFEDVFDSLMNSDYKKVDRIISYSKHSTVDGRDPLCGDIIALRHQRYGNYTIEELAHWYFDAYDTNYIRSHWDIFEGLIWLISSDSEWLPDKYRQIFIQGICKRDRWFSVISKHQNSFTNAVFLKNRKQFKFTKSVLKGLNDLVKIALSNLGIDQSSDMIAQRLVDMEVVSKYYNYQEWIERKRRK